MINTIIIIIERKLENKDFFSFAFLIKRKRKIKFDIYVVVGMGPRTKRFEGSPRIAASCRLFTFPSLVLLFFFFLEKCL